MVCTLTQEQLNMLFQKIVKDLLTSIDEGQPFNIKQYTESIYNRVNEKTGNQALAQTYAALVPSKVALARAVSKEIKKFVPNIQEIEQLEADFEDFDKVGEYLGLVKQAPVIVTDTSGTAQNEAEIAHEELNPVSPIVKTFSAKPNNLHTTTGNEKDPDMAFSYGFIRHLTEGKKVNSEETGYFLTMMRADEAIRLEDVSRNELRSGVAHVITDADGNILYFDDSYNPTNAGNGRPVFFNVRENEETLQTVEERAKTLGISEKDAREKFKAQKEQTDLQKKYIMSGSGRKIIQTIYQASNGFIPEEFGQSNIVRLKPYVAQLGAVDISVIAVPNQPQKTVVTRGPYSQPITIQALAVESDPQFIEDAIDILLGENVVDMDGEQNDSLKDWREQFRKVFFGNNFRLKVKDGILMLNNAPVTDRETIKQALLFYTKKDGNKARNSFNLYQDYAKGVPSYTRKGDKILLSKDGMTPAQYVNFILERSFTYFQPDENGVFKDVNPYFAYSVSALEFEKLKQKEQAPKVIEKIEENTAETIDEALTQEDLNAEAKEIANEYLDAMGQGKFSPVEQAIMDSTGKPVITEASFNRFGDRNNITPSIKSNYISEKGSTADEIARAASEDSGIDIGPEDVIDFIMNWPDGLKGRSNRAKDLAERFTEITGKELTTTVAKAFLRVKDDKKAGSNAEKVVESVYSALQEKGIVDENGFINFDKLVDLLKKDKKFFTVFPLGLTEDEYKTLKNYARFEQAKAELYAESESDTETDESPKEGEQKVGFTPKKFQAPETKSIEEIRKKLNKLDTQRATGEKITEEQIKKAEDWYKNHPLSKYVPFTVMFNAINTSNPRSMATWTEAGITLYKGSNMTDLYHEAFHAFSQMFLSAKERQKIYDDVRKQKGTFTDYAGKSVKFEDADDLQVEEYLAEEFRKYMLSDGKKGAANVPSAKSWFQKLLDILRAMFNFNVEDTLSNYEGSSALNEVFENLRVGNINPVPYGYENRQFDKLDKIAALDPESQARLDALPYNKQMLIVNSIDSLWSKFADEIDFLETSGAKSTSQIASSAKIRADLYNKVIAAFIEKYNELAERLEQLDPSSDEYADLYANVETLDVAIANFSPSYLRDPEKGVTIDDILAAEKDGRGIIAYHMQKSKYLSFEDKFEVLEDAEDKSKIGKGEYNKNSGNEVSARELASNDVLYTLRSLFKYDGLTPVMNDLGFNQLEDFDVSWNRLQKLLEGITDADQMYNAMSLRAKKDPMMAHLLSKIGKPNNFDSSTEPVMSQVNLWTGLYNVFSMKRISLTQLTVNMNSSTGELVINSGRAQAETDQIKRSWDNRFADPSIANQYVRRYTPGATSVGNAKKAGAFLLTGKIRKDFATTHRTDPVRFLNALGMDVSEVQEIVDALKAGKGPLANFTTYLYNAVVYAESIDMYVHKPSELIELEVGAQGSLTGLYKNLLTLEAKYSEKYGSSMVSNAKGDAQFELSLRSSVSNMIDSLNKATSYQELIAMPEMSHLDVNRNPFVKDLYIMRAMFGENFWDKGAGKKQKATTLTTGSKDVKIELQNSSGVALIEDGEFHVLGIASNEADKTTQILQNFYLMLQYGVAEGTRHSDKSTTYLYKVLFGGNKKHYIDISDFADYKNITGVAVEESRRTEGSRKAVNQFMKYLSGEVARIYKLKNNDPSGTATVGDSTYKEVGSKILAFEDILRNETINKIMDKYISDDFLGAIADDAKLRSDITEDILNYIDRQTTKFKNQLADAGALGNAKLMGAVRKLVPNTSIGQDFVDEAVIKAFVVNDWIHKFETTSLFYGDVALYNHLKEEFHKRNAGVGATGTFPRTDTSMLSLLQQHFTPMYASSDSFRASGFEMNSRARNKKWGKTFNSAILEDTAVQSVYMDQYITAAKKAEATRLGRDLTSDENKRIEKAFSEYGEMKIGDAQGWITFDSYRALLVALGKWSKSQEKMYRDIVAGKDVSVEEIAQFFPIKKMQYWGPLKSDGLPLVGFHKFSLMPLIPTVIKNSNLEILHNKMVSQGIDYATFQSGSKINSITKNGKVDKFYTNNTLKNAAGEYDNNVEFASPDYEFTPNEIFLDYFKDQLEIADKYKGSVIFSTQLRKLVEEGLMENGKPVDYKGSKEEWDALPEDEKLKNTYYAKLINYEKLVRNLTDFKVKELIKEADITFDSTTGQFKLTEKLIDFVKKELTRQDLAEHEIDFIKYDRTGNLVYDLSIHPSAEKIEKLLTSLIYKRIVRQKVNGEALIQVSGAGFEASGLRGATAEEIAKYGTNGLSSYEQDTINFDDKYKGYNKSRLQDAYNTLKAKESAATYWTDRYRNALVTELAYLNAKIKGVKPEITEIVNPTSSLQVKIALQGDFKKLLRHPEVIAIAKAREISNLDALNIVIKDERWLAENREMITIAGVRIPVQGLNSMEFMQVAEFLPENSGNMVILPAEIVAKSGSDFDIDKLSLMFPSLIKTSKGVSMTKHDASLAQKVDADVLKQQITDLYQQLTEAQEDVFNFTQEYLKDIPYELKRDFQDSVRSYKQAIAKVKNDIWDQLETGEIYPESLYEEIYNLQEELNDLYAAAAAPMKEYKESKLNPIFDRIDDLKTQIASSSSKGIENDLLNAVVDIISLPSNFVDLVTPNGTYLVKPLADDLAEDVRDYNPFDTDSNEGNAYTYKKKDKDVKRISATRIFELGYNQYKQESNNIGKKTLGMGAVDNSYNTVFNRIGAYMSASVELGQKNKYKVDQVIRGMKHNILKVGENDVISLSNLYDANEENRISTVISQMMNGWVDVAKDSWVFDIQGNPEIASTLLFMIQAGVPVDQAVYFVSQPIIRDYVKLQRKIKGAFARPMNIPSAGTNMFRVEARRQLIERILPEGFQRYSVNKKGQTIDALGDMMLKRTVYTRLVPTFLEEEEPDFSIETLKKNVKAKNGYYTDTDAKAFIHFIELEEMAKATTAIKLGMNFDTSKLTSLYDIREKLSKAGALEGETRLPDNIVDLIENNSPIGSFKTQKPLLDMVANLFPLRDNEALTDHIAKITANMQDSAVRERYGKSFISKEQLIAAMRNDFTNFVLQQFLKHPGRFNPKGPYKGLGVEMEVVPVKKLKFGAFVENGKLYVDMDQMNTDFKKALYDSADYQSIRKLARVKPIYFNNSNDQINRNDYFKFVYEREFLRSTISFDDYSKTVDFGYRVDRLNTQKESLGDIQPERLAYEEFLRDTALFNTMNIDFMFKDPYGFAYQAANIAGMHPELAAKYPLLKSLFPVERNGAVNLKLSELFLDVDKMNIYHENLEELADPNVKKVDNELDNNAISKLFTIFPMFAFFQAGQDGRGQFSLARIVNTNKYAKIMDVASNWALNQVLTSDYAPIFMEQYQTLFDAMYANPVKSDLEEEGIDAISDEFTNNNKPRLKAYYNYPSEKESEDFIKTTEYDPSVKVFETPKTRAEFEKSILANVKEGTVFVFETSTTKYSKTNQSFAGDRYNSTYLKDMAVDGKIPIANLVGIATKPDSFMSVPDTFLTDKTYQSNIETIEKGIQNLIKARDEGKVLVFDKNGYGNVFLGFGGSQKFNKQDKAVETAPAPETFVYLSKRLYEEFGYVNPGYTRVEKTTGSGKALMEQIVANQPVTDDSVREKFKECFKSLIGNE